MRTMQLLEGLEFHAGNPMDPFAAIRAHWEWRVRLRLFVEGHTEPLDARAVRRDDACELGAWIHGEGAQHAATPSYSELKAAHMAFHEAAAEVVERVNAADIAGARALLGPNGTFDHASSAIVLAILKLMREAVPA